MISPQLLQLAAAPSATTTTAAAAATTATTATTTTTTAATTTKSLLKWILLAYRLYRLYSEATAIVMNFDEICGFVKRSVQLPKWYVIDSESELAVSGTCVHFVDVIM